MLKMRFRFIPCLFPKKKNFLLSQVVGLRSKIAQIGPIDFSGGQKS